MEKKEYHFNEISLLDRKKDILTPILNKVQDADKKWIKEFAYLSSDEILELRDELKNPKLKLESPHDIWQGKEMLEFIMYYYVCTCSIESNANDFYRNLGFQYSDFFQNIASDYADDDDIKYAGKCIFWYKLANTKSGYMELGKREDVGKDCRLWALKEAAKLGCEESMIMAANLLLQMGNKIEGIKFYLLAMKRGNKEAQLQLGKILLCDHNRNESTNLAHTCLVDLALTDKRAANELEKIYYEKKSYMDSLMYGVLSNEPSHIVDKVLNSEYIKESKSNIRKLIITWPDNRYDGIYIDESNLATIFDEWAKNRFEIQELRDQLNTMPGGKEWLHAKKRFEYAKENDEILSVSSSSQSPVIDYSLIMNISKYFNIDSV